MKTTTAKKIYSFIIMMVFSFAFVSAQNCNGNKVYVCRTCNGPYGTTYQECDCVSPSQVAIWQVTPCGIVPPNDNGNHGNGNNGHSGGACICRMDNPLTGDNSGDLYPNPFSGSTKFYFTLAETQNVSLRIYGMNGKLVASLADASFGEGEHEIVWNAADVNAGIYFLRLETTGYSKNQKLIVAK